MNLDYHFQNPDLLVQATTHKSYTNEHPKVPNNERLEFLGDAVVQLVVSQYLLENFPQWTEGDLSKARSRLVREDSLAQVARNLALGPQLRLGTGERNTQGYNKDRVLADALEALVGAIYLDGGLAAAQEAVISWLAPSIERVSQNPLRDVRSTLQETIQARGWALPSYEVIDIQGPDHARIFTAQVIVNGVPYGPGVGSSKKAAYEAAATVAVRDLPPPPWAGLPLSIDWFGEPDPVAENHDNHDTAPAPDQK